MVSAHLSKAFRGEASNREEFTDMAQQGSWALQTRVCTHEHTHTRMCTPPASSHSCSHPETHKPTYKNENPGQGATALCHGQASYLFLRGHCAELLTWRAGCADAQFLHPSGPPALAAGLPQPGREKGIRPAQRDHQTITKHFQSESRAHGS